MLHSDLDLQVLFKAGMAGNQACIFNLSLALSGIFQQINECFVVFFCCCFFCCFYFLFFSSYIYFSFENNLVKFFSFEPRHYFIYLQLVSDAEITDCPVIFTKLFCGLVA